MDFLEIQFYGNALRDWFKAAGILLLVLFVLLVIKRILSRRLVKAFTKTSFEIDDFLIPVVQQTKWFTILALGIYLGTFTLTLPEQIAEWIGTGFEVVLLLQLGFWGMGVVTFYINRKIDEKLDQDHGEDATTLDALGLILRIAVWIVVGLVILDNVGVEVNSLVASLGIGGIAVALAVQNILGDLFASLSIALDKPFVIGDFVVVDDFAGTVDEVGLKSTRIRSLSGEELIFSNADLLSSRIRNYKRLERRRISFKIGVEYSTSLEKLKSIPEMIEKVIQPVENATFDRAHLSEMGDFSLIYEIVYFVELPDYNVYMEIQQEINLGILRRFEEEGIGFAFPTQTLLLEQ